MRFCISTYQYIKYQLMYVGRKNMTKKGTEDFIPITSYRSPIKFSEFRHEMLPFLLQICLNIEFHPNDNGII